MYQRIITTFVIAVALVAVAGCGSGDGWIQGENEDPKKVLNRYVEALIDGDYRSVSRYGPVPGSQLLEHLWEQKHGKGFYEDFKGDAEVVEVVGLGSSQVAHPRSEEGARELEDFRYARWGEALKEATQGLAVECGDAESGPAASDGRPPDTVSFACELKSVQAETGRVRRATATIRLTAQCMSKEAPPAPYSPEHQFQRTFPPPCNESNRGREEIRVWHVGGGPILRFISSSGR